ncbi:hypothetical protein M409DRAFT_60914 [Zasmidium cellare ATCC 36951]|uniref:Uncharacterized protein n=1 Tax=Zasmidium cellare ATCC 36951 TaxID=1080233 RepID=A0A6A6BWZ2_ZASCE|nr:uncharacterized protein M409DRAFT_60914 [Zasmidium cellare ATCC 36951]KAF2159331.1 hypothetical protein M409DRAFT_60914 [Zasmidium cellare ATCC 36951]
MLPPQLQHSLRHRSLSTGSITAVRSLTSPSVHGTTACAQARSLWSWRRPCDYASHIDPMYHRFTRYRTLRTRAKLLDKLRRRGRWDWDATQRPFFTPKHVRLAHHIGRPRWSYHEDGKKQSSQEAAEEDGLELSQREKEWKDQMEAMRKRIEMDPYEAVFGKRFEPFWSPLVPSWMREEMGLDRSTRPTEAKSTDTTSTSIPIKPVARRPEGKTEPVKPRERSQSPKPKRDEGENDVPNGQLTTYSYTSKKAVAEPDPECPNGQLTNYSYGSTTSWDSWTKKTRREEWDSISGETRRYEYDPISNRMVQIDGKPPTKSDDLKKVEALKNDTLKAVPESQSTSQDTTSTSPQQQQPTAATTNESRRAIPVPTETTDSTAKKTSIYFPSLLNTSVVSNSTKPSSLATVREKELDLLTAEDVRASMGKANKARSLEGLRNDTDKMNSPKEHAKTSKLETSLDRNASSQTVFKKGSDRPTSSLVSSLARMQSKELPTVDELDDSAAHESTGDRVDYSSTNLPKQWNQQADLLQADRVRRTRGVIPEPRMIDIVQAKKAGEKNADGKPRWIDMMNARKARYDADQVAFKAAQEIRDAQENAKVEKLKAMHNAEVNDQKLHMQAHETRYVHKIRALRQELETACKQSSINAEMQVERIRNLEDELARAQKAAGETSDIARHQTEGEKYQRKISELRKELDASFKQSSVSSGKHVERIRELEKELEKAQASGKTSIQMEKERYVQKTKSLRDELDRTFKQSAANAEKHVERIRELEKELAESRGTTTRRTRGPDAVQAEGDFSANVTKFAKDSSKWYKQPSYTPEVTGKPSAEEIQKAAQKQKDIELVNDVRAIYENRYGKIDVSHRQARPKTTMQASRQIPQVVEVESDVDLGKALADYEAGQTYEYRRDNLEAEIAAQEKEAHEAQELMAPESSGKMEQAIAKSLKLDQDVHGARIVDDTVPRLIPTEIAARTEPAVDTEAEPTKSELNSWGIVWEEPPVYKVLAYDSGNDMFSTATTSSNFTGKETPISIPQALSQLYQPARFVPHFAELQKEGYQVVYGTKDLLVFKKVKTTSETSAVASPESQTNLADHGVVKPTAPETSNEITPHAPGVNPIDGTTYPLEPESAGFASPTGFVGDRWETLASEGKVQSPSTVSKPEAEPESAELKSPHPSYSQPADEDAEIDIRHYPRVKREERVFSGSRLQRPKKQRRHHHEPSQEQVREMKRKWHSWRARFRWALSVGVGASFVAYCIGAAAERKEVREKERWEQILEGRRGRWE